MNEKKKEVDYRWSNECFSNIVSSGSGKISDPELAEFVEKLKKKIADRKKAKAEKKFVVQNSEESNRNR